MNREGSVIVLILIIATAVTILITTTIKTVVTFYALTLERKEYVCQNQALEAVALYGIAAAKMLEKQKINKKEYRHSFVPWPPPNGPYNANVIVLPEQNRCIIKAQLSQNGKTIRVLEGIINRKNDRWNIIQWDFK